MRLASFHADGRNRFGFTLDGKRIYDLSVLVPNSLLDFIEQGSTARQLAEALLAKIRANPDAHPSYQADAVRFLAPITRPSKICCIALNNSANVDRIMSGPKHPAMFVKAASTLTGHGTDIIVKPHFGRVHPEPELAVVIGKQAKDVAASKAYEYVFGYTVHNDVTSPTMRTEDTFHYRAIHAKRGNDKEIEYIDTWVSYPGRYKGCDTFSCMGPWLVTRDEIADPHQLAIECWQNGELITADNTANLFFKVPQVIEFLSSYMTLLEGDIISMGTALKASTTDSGAVQNINLAKSGTKVAVSIERIGVLENTSLMVS
jgi:2-keto-4-pentenoate hydratase/2-oxohepta-3-ene-1,7-dioic acid hydratase in catechol pathway